ncbi:transmembrane 6 superfamily member 1 isoform X1 [Pelobates cultripes]|uniref:Transmembrane 6 superfamily member 1 isoform X1 n=1 Tax=Pelobates cultripes TaxID=61616 RepID=A0AAD1S602_PELCU|nr:transmembrane 6 superfamily member 1 isoform X1 [Pelobates cultripes]
MLAAIARGRSYKAVGLFWLGSLVMSMLVFLPGNVVGKYGNEIRPAFLLNIPYLFLPFWAAIRIFRASHVLPKTPVEKVEISQKERILQRPQDLAMIVYLLAAIIFTIFRGMLALDCPSDACFTYIYQYEPYLRDPVAYPKVQVKDGTQLVHNLNIMLGSGLSKILRSVGHFDSSMLVSMFYIVPLQCLCIYALLVPGCSWMLDWTLIYAGAIAQAQFAHVGSSLYHRTPYTYRVPQDSWWVFIISNILYTLGPQLLAYRCLRKPAYFLRITSHSPEDGKKNN